MRIAFIGKGGSGKSTISALFVDYLLKNFPDKIILAVDADLNIHLAKYLFGLLDLKEDFFLSHHQNIIKIREYLKGNSTYIKTINEFLKTSPPSRGCNIIRFTKDDFILNNFALKKDNIYFMAVGTYQKEELGTACYHVNLSIFENILSFTDEGDNFIVSDMVAGIDFFANTLFNQFDMFPLIIEPNVGNLRIYEHLKNLALEADIYDRIFIVGNKILNEKDKNFIEEHFDTEKIIGYMKFDEYLYNFDFTLGAIDYQKTDKNNQDVLKNIYETLKNKKIDLNLRLKKLIQLHLKYIQKESIKSRFGDLSYQVDENFFF